MMRWDCYFEHWTKKGAERGCQQFSASQRRCIYSGKKEIQRGLLHVTLIGTVHRCFCTSTVSADGRSIDHNVTHYLLLPLSNSSCTTARICLSTNYLRQLNFTKWIELLKIVKVVERCVWLVRVQQNTQSCHRHLEWQCLSTKYPFNCLTFWQ